MKIRFVASDKYGGGHLRSLWPSEALSKIGHTTRSETWYPAIKDGYDVIVIHRPLASETPKRVEEFQTAGAKVFIDEDDDLTTVLQTKNAAAHKHWDAQKEFAHEKAMMMADGVIVSTQRLADVYGYRNENITVVHNALPRSVQEIRHYGKAAESDVVRVNYAAIVQSHLHDIEWLQPVARDMLEGARFVSVGDVETPRTLGVNGLVQEIFGFQENILALYKLMSRAEIGIVPLAPLDFNLAKSYLKALEYMTVGVPVVASYTPEQALLIEHEVNGFLAHSPQEFAAYVQLLVHDPILRKVMAVNAKATASKLAIEDHIGVWETALGVRQMEAA